MATPAPPPGQRLLGRGRSAAVYRATDDAGRPYARKLFVGDTLGSLIHNAFTGATNPYTWNHHAIDAALARRRLLGPLVRYWFGKRVRIPETYGHRFDDDTGAFEIHMEVIRGRPAPLHHQFSAETDGVARRLDRRVMKPLQRHLREAGFDGLVWQAGYANPVAASNFLLERHGGGKPTRWVWLDLESGVPALFPINPLALLRFYAPRSIQHGGALFDDTDTAKLADYLDRHATALQQRLGHAEFEQLRRDADDLARHQRAWRETGRLENGITAARVRGSINDHQAEFFRRHPLDWYTHLAGRACSKLAAKVRGRLPWLRYWLHPARLRAPAEAAWSFCTSGKYRFKLSRALLLRRVHRWRRRGQLKRDDARHLRKHIRADEAAAYLTDFGVHLALKPPVKLVEYGLLPALAATGVITPTLMAIGMATGGTLARTAYTAARTVQAYHKRQPRPWVALVVGVLPVVGNAAYPAQIVATSAHHGHDESVARFMIYDLLTAIGAKLPIWGGPDTQTEHFFNRLPDLVFRKERATRASHISMEPAVEAAPTVA